MATLCALATACTALACAPGDAPVEKPVRVAVASNFLRPMKVLARAFEQEAGIPIEIASGSTGQLYAQIVSGAPFDVFLAADQTRPRRLVEAGLAQPSSRRRYATGQLVLIVHAETLPAVDAARVPRDREVPTHRQDDPNRRTAADTGPPSCLERLLSNSNPTARPIAIANPETAPYGRAARETLEALGTWAQLAPRLARGASVAQAYHFVVSGNAAAGFVSASLLSEQSEPSLSSCRWVVPPSFHAPISQDLVVLKAGAERAAVQAFTEFLRQDDAARIIREAGYLP